MTRKFDCWVSPHSSRTAQATNWTFTRELPPLDNEVFLANNNTDSIGVNAVAGWSLVCEGLMTRGRVVLGGVELGRVNNQ